VVAIQSQLSLTLVTNEGELGLDAFIGKKKLKDALSNVLSDVK
jgi:hypothetical protein